MTLPDWRKPCSLGYYVAHFHWLGDAYMDCPGGSPITYADLEALGEKVWWCGFHDCQGFDAGIGHPYLGYCWEGYYFHDPAIGTLDCRMVERRLLIPLPETQEVVK